MAKKNLWSNVSPLKDGDEVKFVIRDREDFDWSVNHIIGGPNLPALSRTDVCCLWSP